MIGIDFSNKGISALKQTVSASLLQAEYIQLFWQKVLQTITGWKILERTTRLQFNSYNLFSAYSYNFAASIVIERESYSEFFNLKKHLQGGFKTPLSN